MRNEWVLWPQNAQFGDFPCSALRFLDLPLRESSGPELQAAKTFGLTQRSRRGAKETGLLPRFCFAIWQDKWRANIQRGGHDKRGAFLTADSKSQLFSLENPLHSITLKNEGTGRTSICFGIPHMLMPRFELTSGKSLSSGIHANQIAMSTQSTIRSRAWP